MGGIFGVASKSSCTLDLFFGTDYHSHLGTRRGGMASGMVKTALRVQFTTSRTHRFVPNLMEI